jgi:hypothetical protein
MLHPFLGPMSRPWAIASIILGPTRNLLTRRSPNASKPFSFPWLSLSRDSLSVLR